MNTNQLPIRASPDIAKEGGGADSGGGFSIAYRILMVIIITINIKLIINVFHQPPYRKD